MEFSTQTELPAVKEKIDHTQRLMLLGSCFAESIGNLLSDNKFDCYLNPFGVLYNPLSIAKAINRMADNRLYTEADLQYDGHLWYSLMHHSSFSSPEQCRCLELINTRLHEGACRLREARWLILTWGTARVYQWKETGEVVGNCHKLPARCFTRRLLEVDEVVQIYRCLISRLRKLNPDLHILFTVSPIRHAKDGMHGNQLSKAVLLLAIDRLCRETDHLHYFPSYEILLDELRDYRFYADDMLHPSAVAVNYIWECFSKTYFTPAATNLIRDWKEIKQGLEHRPFNPESEAYQSFLSQLLLKINGLKKKFPYLDVQNEIKLCQTRLKK